MTFAAPLVPHRSTWDIVRLSWTPVLAGVLVVIGAKALEGASPAVAGALSMLAGPVFILGLLYITFTWRRGPTLTIDGGELVLADRRVRVADVEASVEQYVFRTQGRGGGGTFWQPLLALRFPDGGDLRLVRLEGGGQAAGRRPTRAPNYGLDPASWDQLAALLGARDR
ncbi:hypothetical protein OV203_32990 [Nannocystis sp. ILAH1]|uniref:hypothetical protein n=1 Tax=unclassified Nannocystis TaxID=2627009 RepID=UPI002271882E|nr:MULTISPECIES: hypothetical protein [unclassified Nannocystis]MCY0992001.1 hypothetical protein [Nannocystis sp. ILAH1]MCY1064250.1 hypothetical protein [Nannocystis sp. RBIL2]